jgi:hypothetical protein
MLRGENMAQYISGGTPFIREDWYVVADEQPKPKSSIFDHSSEEPHTQENVSGEKDPHVTFEEFKKKFASFEEFKEKILSELAEHIEKQRQDKSFVRAELSRLDEENGEQLNRPVILDSAPEGVDDFSKGATFYGYNAEGIRDYEWGCAWRAIQTCLSAYNIYVPFENLFHLFGPANHLKFLYENKFPDEELKSLKSFAPYDLRSGWAEPFVGDMVHFYYQVSSTLESVNGIPGSCNAPPQVFHNKPLEFETFKERLEKHFKIGNAAPIMIDDGTYSLNILGIGRNGLNTTLWIADPHIKEGANSLLSERTPSGLYRITLDETGKQIHCSLNDEDQHQVPNMYSEDSYNGLHFDNKHWMVLFPIKD